MNKQLRTKHAYLFWALGIILGGVVKHFLINFPYEMFGTFWTFGFLGVSAKNLIQKRPEYKVYSDEKDI